MVSIFSLHFSFPHLVEELLKIARQANTWDSWTLIGSMRTAVTSKDTFGGALWALPGKVEGNAAVKRRRGPKVPGRPV